VSTRKSRLFSAALTIAVALSTVVGFEAPAHAAMNLTLAKTIASSNFSTPTWTARGGGYIWVSQSGAVKKIDETTETVSSVTTTGNPQELSWDGTNMWAMMSNGKVAKIAPNGTVTYTASAICSSPGNNDSVAASATQIVASCFTGAIIARINPADATVQETDTGTVSGRVVIAGSYIYASTFQNTNVYRFPISSLASGTRVTIAASLETNHWHRMTSDANYIWITNSNSYANPRVTRIARSNNAVTQITISTAGNYHAIGGVYSDGNKVYITNNTIKTLTVVDVATSAVTDEVTYTAMPNSSVTMGANGLWVLAESAMYRYTSSSLTLPVAPTAPGAPTGVTGTSGAAQVSLSWTAPASTGGSSITDYLIEYLPAGGSWTTWSHTASTSTSATITGLTNGTSYTFRVSAINAVGTSSASTASGAVVPLSAPGAPTLGTITSANAQASVSWTAPSSDGGSAISDYLIEYRAGAGSWVTWSHTASTTTSATITGLTNGTSYTFRVSAINAVGTGTASTISSSYTPATIPGAPTTVAGTRGNAQVSLTWSAPSSSGGSTLTDYLIEYLPSGGSWTTWSHTASTSTSATITGLTNGTSYTFRVSAINAIGTSAASTVSSAIVPATAAGAPTGVTASIGNSQVTLSWTAPSSNGGSEISDYLIEYLPAGGSWTTWSHTASTSTSATITGLTNGTSYTFRVSAINATGTSAASTVSGAATPATSPGSPTSVNGTRGPGQVSLSWTAPAANGGSAISDYLIEYRAGTGAWNAFSHTASTSTTITVTGLTNGVSYTFRVSAINGAGTSAPSTVSSAATPMTSPDAPSNLAVTSGDGEVSLSWSAPASDGGSSITDYLVEYKMAQGSWVTFSHSATTDTVIRVTGLTNDSAYTFRVSAINALGTSNATSESASVTPSAVVASTPPPSSSGGSPSAPAPSPAVKTPSVVEISPTEKTKVSAAWNPVPGAVRYRVTLKPTKGVATVIDVQSAEFKFNAASSVGVTISVESFDANDKSTDVFSKFVFTPQSKLTPAILVSSANNTAALVKAAQSMPAGTSLLVTSEYKTAAQKAAAIRSAKIVEAKLKQINAGLVVAIDFKKVAKVSAKPISVLPIIKPELIKP
jgi:titin